MGNINIKMPSLRELCDEVKREEKTIRKIRQNVEDILEEDFDGIYDFFLKLHKKKYGIVILMSRRCLVLWQIFLRFYLLDGLLLNESRTVVLSDQAVPFYLNEFNNQNIAIVDDILIHGRTIRKLYSLIEEKCSGVKPDVYVYVKDTNVDCLSEKLEREIDFCCVTYKAEWRSLSNRIVNCIFAANEPYTSFVASYYGFGNQDILNDLYNNHNLKSIDITGQMQNCQGISAKFIYEERIERDPVLTWLSEGEGVRIYWNSNICKYTIIPYVFVRSMCLEECEKAFLAISEALPDTMSMIKGILEQNQHEDLFYEYKLRLITCILSNVYWLDFAKRYHLCESDYVDIDTLNRGFGSEIALELLKLEEISAEKILQLSGERQEIGVEINDELNTFLEESADAAEDVRDFLKMYFQKAWFLDEQRALQGLERYKGLILENFLNEKEERDDRYLILANMVNIWDNGLATANYAMDSMKRMIGCFIAPGEQSYKIILEKYPALMKMLVFISKIIKRRKSDKSLSDEEYTQHRIDVLLRFVEEFYKKYKFPDYSFICEIIKYEKGYLNAWNQSEILKNAMKNDKMNDEEILKEFVRVNL